MSPPPEKPHAPVSAQAGLHDDIEEVLTVEEAERLVERWRGIKRAAKILLFIGLPVVLIFVAIALPSAVRAPCRSHQQNAATNLRAAYVAQESYFAEYDVYLEDLGATGFRPRGQSRYWLSVTDVGRQSFEITAVGNPDTNVAGDVWTINHENQLRNVRDACAGL